MILPSQYAATWGVAPGVRTAASGASQTAHFGGELTEGIGATEFHFTARVACRLWDGKSRSDVSAVPRRLGHYLWLRR